MSAQYIESKPAPCEEAKEFSGFEELLHKSLDEMLASDFGMSRLVSLTEHLGNNTELH